MALGDGIRRNIAHVSDAERTRFINAVVQLNSRYYPDGVSKWVKQDQIHEATHVHGGASFLPWHRELLNRYEELLREIDPELSLHYWDWTEDPRAANNGSGGTYNIFTTAFMGESNGNVSDPFVGFPPISRDVAGGAAAPSPPGVDSDNSIVNSSNGFPQAEQWQEFRLALESTPNHNSIHGYIGGTIGPPHTAFEDPFVYLIHSNVDRIWARWQTEPGQEWRLDPLLTYGNETNDPDIVENMAPWDGSSGLRPWAPPDNQQLVKNSKDISIVIPPCYDTNSNLAPHVVVDNLGAPPVIHFNDIPSGDTASRAAVFKVYGCGDATIRVKPGFEPAAPFSILYPASGSITAGHAPEPYVIVHIWLGYTAGAANVPVADGAVTFECVESGQEFEFVIKANSIIRPRVAVMLVLDQSGSMAWDAGTSGLTRLDVLKDAATKFMEIIPVDSGVGLIRFDDNAYPVNHATYPGLEITRINSDADRIAGISAVASHGAYGGTSVGDGVQMGRDLLNALPAGDYEEKAMIVFTDGLENQPVSIESVSGAINNRTFAIGLGNESQVNTNALTQLTNGTGGYLKLSGLLSSSIDDYFRVPKYFMQILAGVTNNNIILDPTGYVAAGQEVRIPFIVNEADLDATVILMVDIQAVDIAIETPNGDLITPLNVAALGIDYSIGNKSRNYKFTFPVAFPAGNHSGEWFVLLKLNKDDFKKQLSVLRDRNPDLFQSAATHGVRYSVIVNTYSNLKMEASVSQDSFEPMANVHLNASLTEYGLPIENRAAVNVEVNRPDGTMVVVPLNEVGPGIFENSFVANIPGIYKSRMLAGGSTIRGNLFTREKSFEPAVFQGGDRPTKEPVDTGKDGSLVEIYKRCCTRITRMLLALIVLVVIFILITLRR